MTDIIDDTAFFSIVKETVEKHGCRIVDVDFDFHVINLDGPEEAMDACAMALENLIN